MHPFILERPRDLAAALAFRAQAGRNDAPVEYIAGGTDMVQLLQENVRRPDVWSASRGNSTTGSKSGEPVSASEPAATMAVVAAHPARAPAVPGDCGGAVAIGESAGSNQATMGGNLLQRTRCPYFRDVGYEPMQQAHSWARAVPRLEGENRWHAVLGTSEDCIAAHASDVAVALVALDAVGRSADDDGSALFRSGRLLSPAGSTPHIQTVLEPGEVITRYFRAAPSHGAAVTLRQGSRPCFLRVRARLRGGGLDMDGGRIREARVALGGVGRSPGASRRSRPLWPEPTSSPQSLRQAAALAAQERKAMETTTSRST